MYLSNDEQTQVMIRSIVDAKKLVEDGKISTEAAYYIILAAIEHHSDWPKPERTLAAPERPPVPFPEEPVPAPDIEY